MNDDPKKLGWFIVSGADPNDSHAIALWWLAAKQSPDIPECAREMIASGGNPQRPGDCLMIDVEPHDFIAIYEWAKVLPGWSEDDPPLFAIPGDDGPPPSKQYRVQEEG